MNCFHFFRFQFELHFLDGTLPNSLKPIFLIAVNIYLFLAALKKRFNLLGILHAIPQNSGGQCFEKVFIIQVVKDDDKQELLPVLSNHLNLLDSKPDRRDKLFELRRWPFCTAEGFSEEGLGFMRILVVDDNDQMREMLRLMLETAGHEVMDAENGKIALHLLKIMPADLVITDVIMPEMEGIELIMKIRKIAPRVKIIAISGGGKVDPDLCLKIAGQLGADRILLKPFSKAAILSIVSELFTDSNLHSK